MNGSRSCAVGGRWTVGPGPSFASVSRAVVPSQWPSRQVTSSCRLLEPTRSGRRRPSGTAPRPRLRPTPCRGRSRRASGATLARTPMGAAFRHTTGACLGRWRSGTRCRPAPRWRHRRPSDVSADRTNRRTGRPRFGSARSVTRRGDRPQPEKNGPLTPSPCVHRPRSRRTNPCECPRAPGPQS